MGVASSPYKAIKCVKANNSQIFWSILSPFWLEVHKILQKVRLVEIPFMLEAFYLDVLFSCKKKQPL